MLTIENNKVLWKCYKERLVNMEDTQNKDGISPADLAEGPLILVDSSVVNKAKSWRRKSFRFIKSS